MQGSGRSSTSSASSSKPPPTTASHGGRASRAPTREMALARSSTWSKQRRPTIDGARQRRRSRLGVAGVESSAVEDEIDDDRDVQEKNADAHGAPVSNQRGDLERHERGRGDDDEP